MPGSNGDDGTLALGDSGLGWSVDTGSVWSETPNGSQNSNNGSGWGNFGGQLLALGANIGSAFASKALRGNGYQYNTTPYGYGPGFPYLNFGAPPNSQSPQSPLAGILIILAVVFIAVKVFK